MGRLSQLQELGEYHQHLITHTQVWDLALVATGDAVQPVGTLQPACDPLFHLSGTGSRTTRNDEHEPGILRDGDIEIR